MNLFFNVIFGVIPLVAVGFVFYRIYRYDRYPLELEDDEVVITEYTAPDNLTPAEVGLILDQKVTGRDLTAEFIYLTQRGYMSIEKIESGMFRDYRLTLLDSTGIGIASFERDLLKRVFTQTNQLNLSSLKYQFVDDLQEIGHKVWVSVIQKGYAKASPITYFIRYGLIIVFLILLDMFFVTKERPILAIVYIFSTLFVFFALYFIQPLTKKGLEMKRYLFGLKKYLEIAERDRILFFSGPQLDSFEFDPLASYSVALGVVPEWARIFSNIYEPRPEKRY